eukprot:4565709-Pyramimonas_sp.AAC.1
MDFARNYGLRNPRETHLEIRGENIRDTPGPSDRFRMRSALRCGRDDTSTICNTKACQSCCVNG